MANSNLPFPRGSTASDYGNAGLTLSDTYLQEYEGIEYEVDDTIHNTGQKVTLRIVKNDTGSAITPATQLFQFSTGAKDYGRRVGAVTGTAGMVCVPIDDAYNYKDVEGTATAFTPTDIPDDDLFYVVIKGPCLMMTGGTSINLATHGAVVCDAAGALGAAVAAAGKNPIGTIDQATTDTDTAVLVWADVTLKNVPAA